MGRVLPVRPTPSLSRSLGAVGAVAVLALGAAGCGAGGDGTSTEDAVGRTGTDPGQQDARRQATDRRAAAVVESRAAETARLRREVADADAAAARAAEADELQGSREVARSSAGSSSGSGGKLLSAADRRSFRALESTLGGASGVAVSGVGTGQRVSRAGSLQSAIAWSTSKVPVAMAAISAGTAQQGALTRAITASDNAAAETLWQSLGGGERAAAAATEQVRAAGDGSTEIQSRTLRSGFTAFGQTVWTLGDQATFTAGLPCSSEGRKVLGLMGRTIAAQRWGLGSTSWSASIKGGWGPGSDPGEAGGYIDRQMGILTSGGRQLAVTIMTRPTGGSHEAGTANLTRIARWVVQHVSRAGLPTEASC